MSKKTLIAIDAGHSVKTAGKRTPPIPELNNRVIHENEFNLAVAKYLIAELNRCGVDTVLVSDPTGVVDTPLSDRANLANSKKADAYISIHYNAFDGKFDAYDPEGHSVHIYPGAKDSRKLAEYVLKYLVQGTKQKNRGIVENNFYVLRKTTMPAILSENGFMDNKREALLMVNVDFQKEVAREHAQGICEYFGVKYVAEPTTKNFTRIQTGAFKILANAQSWLQEVKKAGFDTYLVSHDGLYKVQVGAFSSLDNAISMENKLKQAGFPTYRTTEQGTPVAISTPTSTPKPTPTPSKVDKVDLNKVALEVINGKWGSGSDRKKALEKAGFNYNAVQKIVNDIINKGKPTTKTLKVGSKVKVKNGARTFENKSLASSVYRNVYDVIQINGNRVVIGVGKTVTAAINKNDLIVQ